ncbi:MAG TPA: DeoR/GlpR family DNA-binding transcription regulator [Kiritimatiellia bacterium]|nr:DeoR/GlpR family DNA-binding transcription regulator [Kiritimatiellia bacterium]HPS08822.1 DeoR/GlpR family DNA-binding transcription regulator [Kiritimatiellia bacterium]
MTKKRNRKQLILETLMEAPELSVGELSRRFGVSEVTIRSDLKSLETEGLVLRQHGGGLPTLHANVAERQRTHTDEKLRIARAAAEMIADCDDVMITAGTTTSLIPRFLLGRQGVNIVTNSTLLLPHVRNNPGVTVTLAGGEFRPAIEALTGPATIRELRQFHVAKAFLGSDGISSEKGTTADSAEIADVCRLMSEQARQTIVLADSSKLGRAGFAHIMPAARMDILITDSGAPAAEVAKLRKKGVDVRLV